MINKYNSNQTIQKTDCTSDEKHFIWNPLQVCSGQLPNKGEQPNAEQTISFFFNPKSIFKH